MKLELATKKDETDKRADEKDQLIDELIHLIPKCPADILPIAD